MGCLPHIDPPVAQEQHVQHRNALTHGHWRCFSWADAGHVPLGAARDLAERREEERFGGRWRACPGVALGLGLSALLAITVLAAVQQLEEAVHTCVRPAELPEREPCKGVPADPLLQIVRPHGRGVRSRPLDTAGHTHPPELRPGPAGRQAEAQVRDAVQVRRDDVVATPPRELLHQGANAGRGSGWLGAAAELIDQRERACARSPEQGTGGAGLLPEGAGALSRTVALRREEGDLAVPGHAALAGAEKTTIGQEHCSTHRAQHRALPGHVRPREDCPAAVQRDLGRDSVRTEPVRRCPYVEHASA
mmetsp:Transcript_16462/g.49699  ORF Transcript_16462/g.49699 Transcript_16462/m.49699 type:complete len:306 (-) Transcript_16462:1357-2274(-)